MNNCAKAIPVLAVDSAEFEEELQVFIEVRSIKHNCNIAYLLLPDEIDEGYVPAIIRTLKYQIKQAIREKLNAASQRKKS